MITLPDTGRPHADILKEMESFRARDVNYKEGRTWSLVYHLGEEYTDFLKQAHGLFFSENGLNPMAFKSLKRFEHEVVRMAADILGGDDNTVGILTSGGTESCLLPVLAYRERALKKRRLWGIRPEIIVPETIHVAWVKAAKYFNVKLVTVPLDAGLQMDVEAVRKKINRHTAMIVASAPNYPHGIIDPIEELGELAQSHDIPFHVDACVGGFFLPFMDRKTYPLPPYDFQVPGVTSISADIHKYGYAAKGASVLLYRNMDYLKHQFFIHQDWPGGVFASPALLGTRPGGPIAAAWAATQAMGRDGYQAQVSTTMEVTEKLKAGIRALDGLEILGIPQGPLFGFHSTDPDLSIFAVGDAMEAMGWHIDRLQRPEGLHAMVTPAHLASADSYLADLKRAVDQVRSQPGRAAQGNAAMYGMIARIPFRGMIGREVMKMMEKLYGPRCEMPMEADAPQPLTVRMGSRIMNGVSRRFNKQR